MTDSMIDYTTISVTPEIRDHLQEMKDDDESLENYIERLLKAYCEKNGEEAEFFLGEDVVDGITGD